MVNSVFEIHVTESKSYIIYIYCKHEFVNKSTYLMTIGVPTDCSCLYMVVVSICKLYCVCIIIGCNYYWCITVILIGKREKTSTYYNYYCNV